MLAAMRAQLREWKVRITRDASDRAIAAQLGISGTTLANRLSAEPPHAPTVVDMARAFGALPVDGLVAAGILTEDEARAGGVADGLRAASTRELAEEIVRREKESDRSERKQKRAAAGRAMAERFMNS